MNVIKQNKRFPRRNALWPSNPISVKINTNFSLLSHLKIYKKLNWNSCFLVQLVLLFWSLDLPKETSKIEDKSNESKDINALALVDKKKKKKRRLEKDDGTYEFRKHKKRPKLAVDSKGSLGFKDYLHLLPKILLSTDIWIRQIWV